ncbi:MAG TPA: hypothetical protein VNT60_03685 [Deinococcales bacterium]|nr:hypothetical protein [Deinococcales bacterium]
MILELIASVILVLSGVLTLLLLVGSGDGPGRRDRRNDAPLTRGAKRPASTESSQSRQ